MLSATERSPGQMLQDTVGCITQRVTKGNPCDSQRRVKPGKSPDPKTEVLNKQTNATTYTHHAERFNKSVVNIKQVGLRNTSKFLLNSKDYKTVHISRLEQLDSACESSNSSSRIAHKRRYNMKSYYSKNFDFAYCKVPKVGSTFWTILFAVLEYGVTAGKMLLDSPRSKVHFRRYNFTTTFSSLRKEYLRTVIISRDPYTRLYSAYIDKIYLPLHAVSSYKASKLKFDERSVPSVDCSQNTTFQQFLERVVHSSLRGAKLNPHWAPITSLCRPCELNRFVHVKQESFSKDIQIVLNELRVKEDLTNFLVSTMKDRRIEYTIPGIVTTVYEHVRLKLGNSCMSWQELARRVWMSFQIQGYLRKSVNFPSEAFKSKKDFMNDSFLSNVILTSISKHPLNSTESKLQRQSYLCDAYKRVNPNTITLLQKVFSEDFRIYGYNDTSPCLFSSSKYTSEL